MSTATITEWIELNNSAILGLKKNNMFAIERIQLILLASALLGSIFFLIAPMSTHAAEDTESSPVVVNINVDAGIGPSSTLYILDTLFERIGIWLAGSTEEEIEVLLGLAEEKIAESAEAAGTDEEAADVAARRYEKYIAEAVKKAAAASDEEGEDAQATADALLMQVGEASYTHIDAFVNIAGTAAAAESEYIDRVFTTLQEQEVAIIEGIQDEETREQAIENLQTFIDTQRDKLPPEVEEKLNAVFESLLDKLKEFAKEQANKQLDKAKDQLIETIEEIEF